MYDYLNRDLLITLFVTVHPLLFWVPSISSLTNIAVSYNEPLPKATSNSIFSDLHPPRPLSLLIRATDGKPKEKRKDKVKLSTVVQADALPTFFERYAEVCKSGMTTMKPRDRKRRTKARRKKAVPGGTM